MTLIMQRLLTVLAATTYLLSVSTSINTITLSEARPIEPTRRDSRFNNSNFRAVFSSDSESELSPDTQSPPATYNNASADDSFVTPPNRSPRGPRPRPESPDGLGTSRPLSYPTSGLPLIFQAMPANGPAHQHQPQSNGHQRTRSASSRVNGAHPPPPRLRREGALIGDDLLYGQQHPIFQAMPVDGPASPHQPQSSGHQRTRSANGRVNGAPPLPARLRREGALIGDDLYGQQRPIARPTLFQRPSIDGYGNGNVAAERPDPPLSLTNRQRHGNGRLPDSTSPFAPQAHSETSPPTGYPLAPSLSSWGYSQPSLVIRPTDRFSIPPWMRESEESGRPQFTRPGTPFAVDYDRLTPLTQEELHALGQPPPIVFQHRSGNRGRVRAMRSQSMPSQQRASSESASSSGEEVVMPEPGGNSMQSFHDTDDQAQGPHSFGSWQLH